METAANETGTAYLVNSVTDDVNQHYFIAGWKGDSPQRIRLNTARLQVKTIEIVSLIPRLNRHRRIWVYLPKTHNSFWDGYPVPYLHDGQNLFSEKTAP